MTKKSKKIVKKEVGAFVDGNIVELDAAQKRLYMVQNAHEYKGDDLKKPEHEWIVVPIQSKRVKSKDEFENAVYKAKIKLFHEKWDDARQAACKLSQVGGVGKVMIVSSKYSVKHSIMATFDNGDQVASFQRVEAPR